MSTKPKSELQLTHIYVLKDPDSREIRYVGKTVKDILSRLGEHIGEAKRKKSFNKRLQWIRDLMAANKLPIIEEIDSCHWNESQGKEMYYIQYYKNLGCELLNETEGGEGCINRIVSEETKKLISEKARERAPKVYQYDLEGNLVKCWDSPSDAADFYGYKNASGITRCLRGDRFKYKDFIWLDHESDNANEKLLENQKLRHIRNVSKENHPGTKQCLLGRIISQESILENTSYIQVYDKNNHFLYEGISGLDVSSFINNYLDREDIDLSCRISSIINTDKLYYNMFSFKSSETGNKNKYLLIITDSLGNTYYGVSDAANKLGVKKTNVINNLKKKTKTVNTSLGKLSLTWRINKEHCRLYMKVYGLSADEIEENAKLEIEHNIELT